ncbi:MAG: hypothetical protein HKO07_07015, partial [Pseudomonadales bacterium]|nr:hypothetical protein [Pseudomonadales bacterium]
MRPVILTLLKSVACGLGFLSAAVYASLVPVDIDGNTANGNEGVYDPVLDITWLANANLAQSNDFGLSGIGASGNMQWATAEAFVNAMNAVNGGAGYLGVNTWRHPTIAALDAGGTYNTNLSDNGASDFSYNLSAPQSVQYNPLAASPGFLGSELAYHYYNNFGGIAACNGTNTVVNNQCVSSQPEDVYGIDDAPDPDNNKQLFTNILNTGYWSGSELNAADM